MELIEKMIKLFAFIESSTLIRLDQSIKINQSPARWEIILNGSILM